MLFHRSFFSCCLIISSISLISHPISAQEKTFKNPSFTDIYPALNNSNINVAVSGSCHSGGSDVLNSEHNAPFYMGYHVRPQTKKGTTKFRETTANHYCQLLNFDTATAYETLAFHDLVEPLHYQSASHCTSNPQNALMIIKNRSDAGNYSLQWHYSRNSPNEKQWSLGVFTSITCQKKENNIADSNKENIENITAPDPQKTLIYYPKASLIYDTLLDRNTNKLVGNCSSNYPYFDSDLDSDVIALGYSRTQQGVFKDKKATLKMICRAAGYGTVLKSTSNIVPIDSVYTCDNNNYILLSVLDKGSAVRIIQKPTTNTGWTRYQIDSVECTNPYIDHIVSSNTIQPDPSLWSFGYSITDLGTFNQDDPTSTVLAVVSNDFVGYPQKPPRVSLLYLDGDFKEKKLVTLESTTPAWPIDANFQGTVSLGDVDGDGPGVITLAVGVEAPQRQLSFVNLDKDGNILEVRNASVKLFSGYNNANKTQLFGQSIVNLGHLISTEKITLAIGTGQYGLAGLVMLLTFDPAYVMDEDNILTSEDFDTILINRYSPNGPQLSNLALFGTSIAKLGDIDGDGPGIQAIAVGAPQDSSSGRGSPGSGAIHILNLDNKGSIVNKIKIDSASRGFPLRGRNQVGQSLAFLGNYSFNQDGYLTLAMGYNTGNSYLRIMNINKNGTVDIQYDWHYSENPLYFAYAIANITPDTAPDPNLVTLAISDPNGYTSEFHIVTLGPTPPDP